VAISLKDRRTQLAAGGGLVAALIVLVLVKVLLGGGGTPETLTPSTGFTPNPTTSPSPTPSPTTSPIVIFGGRDPFQPLFVSTTAPTGSPTPTSTGTGSPSPTGTGSPSPSGTSAQGSSTTIGGHHVQIDDIFVSTSGVKKAQVEVDGTVYTVAAGQTFDDNFKLVSFVGDPCGNFVFGDQSFQLCTAGGK